MNKRNPNYTKAETETLVSLVADHIDIIKCKSNDAMSVRKKEESWKFIENIFNMESTVYRNHRELRKKYENLKADWKRKIPDKTMLFTIGKNNEVLAKKIKSNDDGINLNDALKQNELVEIKNELESDDYSDTYCENNNISNNQLDDENHAAQLEEFIFCDPEAKDIWYNHSEIISKTPQCETFHNSDLGETSTSSTAKLIKEEETWSEKDKLKLETDIIREQHQEFLKNKILEREFLIEKQEMARERHKLEMEILRLELEKKKKELI